MKAIEVLVNHPEVNGNQSKAAAILGKKPQNVWFWINNENGVDMPVGLIPKAAQALGLSPLEFCAKVFE